MHEEHVNKEVLKKQTHISALCGDIEMRSVDIDVLAKAIFDKVDSLPGSDDVDAINTFTICIARSVELIKQHNEAILELTSKKGDA